MVQICPVKLYDGRCPSLKTPPLPCKSNHSVCMCVCVCGGGGGVTHVQYIGKMNVG